MAGRSLGFVVALGIDNYVDILFGWVLNLVEC